MDSIDIIIQNYLDEMKAIQNGLYQMLETEDASKVDYYNFFQILDNYKIRENPDKLRSVLHLLSKMNSHYNSNFDNLEMYEKIIINYKDEIQKYFQNHEIFTIFEYNLRILLFLIKSNLLQIDYYVLIRMKINQYSAYFYPEIKEFLNKDEVEEMMKKIPSNFEELREKGETDSCIIEFIRKDSIDDFIVYTNKAIDSLSFEIKPSILETNSFLIKENKDLTLIEYAAFFGSFRIFQYLLTNDVELKPELWIYAIRGRNPEIINILEEKNIKPEGNMNLVYKNYYMEAIKCHHNEIANYVFQNFQKKKKTFLIL